MKFCKPHIRSYYASDVSEAQADALMKNIEEWLPERKLTAEDAEFRVTWDYGKVRNLVFSLRFRGNKLVAKRFRKPFYPVGLAMRFYGSKARRAMENAVRLEQAGFKTARPLFVREQLRCGAVGEQWLITEKIDSRLLYDVRRPEVSVAHRRAILRALSHYMFRLHNAGILPLDFNAGNIFYIADDTFLMAENPDESQIHDFALIDINRMRFGGVPTFDDAMKSFDQLGILPEEYADLLFPYADLRGWNHRDCIDKILRIRRLNRLKKRILHFKFFSSR